MVRNVDLARYNVIVLPHGNPAAYQEILGEQGVARLRRWTQDGGTLVLLKGAAAMATRKGIEWTSSTLKRDEAQVRLFFEQPQTAASRRSPAIRRRRGEAGRPSDHPRHRSCADPGRDPQGEGGSAALSRLRLRPRHRRHGPVQLCVHDQPHGTERRGLSGRQDRQARRVHVARGAGGDGAHALRVGRTGRPGQRHFLCRRSELPRITALHAAACSSMRCSWGRRLRGDSRPGAGAGNKGPEVLQINENRDSSQMTSTIGTIAISSSIPIQT